MKGQWYWVYGFWPAAVGAVIGFFAAWICSVDLFGFGVGLAVGWIPSLLAAVLAYYAVRLLWAPLVGLLAMAALVVAGT